MRRTGLVAAIAGVCLLAGCTTPTPAASPSGIDFTAPGAAAAMIGQLMATAGTTRAVSVELTRSEAHLSIVTGQAVVTYAYRNQKISTIDSDVNYVGQAMFDPRSFNLNDLGSLFAQAAAVAGSSQNQELQISDYDSGHVYMTVTTTPATVPVFFAPDATLVPTLDPTNPSSLGPALTSVVGSATQVVRLGIDSTSGVYADLAAGPGQVMRVVRGSYFPVRDQLKPEASPPGPFDPSLVTAATMDSLLTRVADHFNKPLSAGYSVIIQCQPGETTPSATVTVGGKTAHATLTGVILTS